MQKAYLIPGLGADSRIFKYTEVPGYEKKLIDWIEPGKTDTLEAYSQRIIDQYHIEPDSIIIGNSMGGMIAVEIAKVIRLEKVILISSIKTVGEAPRYFSLFRILPVYKIIPGKLLTSLGFLIKPLFGKMSGEDAWLFNDMLKQSSPMFVKWAMGAILKWNNQIKPDNIYQITGDKDSVFDYKRIPDAEIIKGGTHIMIFDKAKEVNSALKKILNK